MSMSDRVVVMDRGEIVQVGRPVDLYRAPASLFVASFVGSPNVWRGRLAEPGGERAVVEVDGRRLLAPPARGCAAGDEVALVLRPESIRLADRPADGRANGADSVDGTVADVRFIGAVVNYRVDVGGRDLTVTCPSRDTEMLAEGHRVTASWRPEDVLLLRAGESPSVATGTASVNPQRRHE